MATVYIPKDMADLADRLAKKNTSSGKQIFSTYMTAMVFAAMVGRTKNSERTPVASKNRGPEIYDDIFERGGMDSVAFLLALQDAKDGEILRDKNDTELWRSIEEYAASGFNEINNWLIENASDTDGVETILSEMKSQALKIAASDEEEPDIEPIDF